MNNGPISISHALFSSTSYSFTAGMPFLWHLMLACMCLGPFAISHAAETNQATRAEHILETLKTRPIAPDEFSQAELRLALADTFQLTTPVEAKDYQIPFAALAAPAFKARRAAFKTLKALPPNGPMLKELIQKSTDPEQRYSAMAVLEFWREKRDDVREKAVTQSNTHLTTLLDHLPMSGLKAEIFRILDDGIEPSALGEFARSLKRQSLDGLSLAERKIILREWIKTPAGDYGNLLSMISSMYPNAGTLNDEALVREVCEWAAKLEGRNTSTMDNLLRRWLSVLPKGMTHADITAYRKTSTRMRTTFLCAELRHGHDEAIDDFCEALSADQNLYYSPVQLMQYLHDCPQDIKDRVADAYIAGIAKKAGENLNQNNRMQMYALSSLQSGISLSHRADFQRLLEPALADTKSAIHPIACLLAWHGGDPTPFRQLDITKLNEDMALPPRDVFDKLAADCKENILLGDEVTRAQALDDFEKLYRFHFKTLYVMRESKTLSSSGLGYSVRSVCNNFICVGIPIGIKLQSTHELEALATWSNSVEQKKNLNISAWEALEAYLRSRGELTEFVARKTQLKEAPTHAEIVDAFHAHFYQHTSKNKTENDKDKALETFLHIHGKELCAEPASPIIQDALLGVSPTVWSNTPCASIAVFVLANLDLEARGLDEYPQQILAPENVAIFADAIRFELGNGPEPEIYPNLNSLSGRGLLYGAAQRNTLSKEVATKSIAAWLEETGTSKNKLKEGEIVRIAEVIVASGIPVPTPDASPKQRAVTAELQARVAMIKQDWGTAARHWEERYKLSPALKIRSWSNQQRQHRIICGMMAGEEKSTWQHHEAALWNSYSYTTDGILSFHLRRGDPKAAMAYWERIHQNLSSRPSRPSRPMHLQLAWSFAAAGKHIQARDIAHKILRNDASLTSSQLAALLIKWLDRPPTGFSDYLTIRENWETSPKKETAAALLEIQPKIDDPELLAMIAWQRASLLTNIASPENMHPILKGAADQPETFYGELARLELSASPKENNTSIITLHSFNDTPQTKLPKMHSTAGLTHRKGKAFHSFDRINVWDETGICFRSGYNTRPKEGRGLWLYLTNNQAWDRPRHIRFIATGPQSTEVHYLEQEPNLQISE